MISDIIMKLMLCICSLVVAFLIFILIDTIGSSYQNEHQGLIIDKYFSGGKTSTGVGTGISSDGNIITTVVSSTSSDEYIIFVSMSNKIFKCSTSKETFFQLQKGNIISFWEFRGWITKTIYGYGIK